MDYRKLELSFHEKAGFRAAVISTGMMIGWAFYDSVIAGLAAGIALMMTENMYKKGLLEKRKRRLLESEPRSLSLNSRPCLAFVSKASISLSLISAF